jgi:transposase InsO family protein
VARLMRVNKISKRIFDVIRPNKIWVTDITYIRTWEGWLYDGVGHATR